MVELKTITDNGPGKSNWFELGGYISALEQTAIEKNVGIKKIFSGRDYSRIYQQVLKENAEQIKHNLQTVFGQWIELYNKEKKEITKLELRAKRKLDDSDKLKYLEKVDELKDEELTKELELKNLQFKSTNQIYKSFGIPTGQALESIEKKDWKGLEKAIRYKFNMSYV